MFKAQAEGQSPNPQPQESASLDSAQLPALPPLNIQNELKRVREIANLKTGGYCSLSDMVYAVLLEKYLPNFSAVPGLSIQVEIGRNKDGNPFLADFRYQNRSVDLIIENHQANLWKGKGRRIGDFPNKESQQEFFDKLREAETREEKLEIRKSTRKELLVQYAEARRKLIAANPKLKDVELVVVSDPFEFQEKILQRLLGSRAPDAKLLAREFDALKDAAFKALPVDRRNPDKAKHADNEDECVRPHGSRGKRNFFGFRG